MDTREHIVFCSIDFDVALQGLQFLIAHGYRELRGNLERLEPKTARIVPGRALGLWNATIRVCFRAAR